VCRVSVYCEKSSKVDALANEILLPPDLSHAPLPPYEKHTIYPVDIATYCVYMYKYIQRESLGESERVDVHQELNKCIQKRLGNKQ
jgi:hypothetical protein